MYSRPQEIITSINTKLSQLANVDDTKHRELQSEIHSLWDELKTSHLKKILDAAKPITWITWHLNEDLHDILNQILFKAIILADITVINQFIATTNFRVNVLKFAIFVENEYRLYRDNDLVRHAFYQCHNSSRDLIPNNLSFCLALNRSHQTTLEVYIEELMTSKYQATLIVYKNDNVNDRSLVFFNMSNNLFEPECQKHRSDIEKSWNDLKENHLTKILSSKEFGTLQAIHTILFKAIMLGDTSVIDQIKKSDFKIQVNYLKWFIKSDYSRYHDNEIVSTLFKKLINSSPEIPNDFALTTETSYHKGVYIYGRKQKIEIRKDNPQPFHQPHSRGIESFFSKNKNTFFYGIVALTSFAAGVAVTSMIDNKADNKFSI